MLHTYLLISEPFITISQMDNTTIAKAVCLQQTLHYMVIAMGVGSQIIALVFTPVDYASSYAMHSMNRCQAMDGSIGAMRF